MKRRSPATPDVRRALEAQLLAFSWNQTLDTAVTDVSRLAEDFGPMRRYRAP